MQANEKNSLKNKTQNYSNYLYENFKGGDDCLQINKKIL